MIKSSIPFSGRVVGTAIVVSLLTGACSNGNSAQGGGQMPSAMPVQVQQIDASTVQETSEFVGSLEAQKRVDLKPQVEGRIVDILVASGQSVDAGTLLIQLDPDKNQAQVRGATADVESAVASRNTALAQLRASQADQQRAAADVKLQDTEFQRTQVLVAQGAQSQQDLDRARNNRETALATLKAAQENVQAAQAALNEANAKVGRAQADRSSARVDLRYNRVTAPIAGVVGNVPVKVGDYVKTDTTLTSIIQNQALDLNLAVPIERAGQLRLGLPVQLLDENNQPLTTGRISFISPEVNSSQQSVLAKATFDNNGRLRDGQFVKARVIWSSKSGVLVPTSAVTRVAGQTFVFVAEPGQPANKPGAEASPAPQGDKPQEIARQRPVQLGSIQGNNYQVISGVKPGDKLIVSGILNLSDGVPVMVGPPGGQNQAGASPAKSP